ncbi:MAG: YciI family protein [Isosphaeraceae bacterium]
MRYMLLIYGAESCWTERERMDCMIESMAICEELAAEGKLVASAPLHSVSTATSLRVRDGKRLVTDGPFAETTEQLGGYYIVDVEHLDDAIAIAGRLPPAKKGTVEIRPIFDLASLREPVVQAAVGVETGRG